MPCHQGYAHVFPRKCHGGLTTPLIREELGVSGVVEPDLLHPRFGNGSGNDRSIFARNDSSSCFVESVACNGRTCGVGFAWVYDIFLVTNRNGLN